MNNQSKDLGLAPVCPNCSAPLPIRGRGGVGCAYCGTVLVHGRPEALPPRPSRPARPARRHKAITVPKRPRTSRVLLAVALFLLLAGACPVLTGTLRKWPARLASLVRPGESSKQVTVPAGVDWHATGLRIRPGQTVTVAYVGGTWSVWGGPRPVP
jgi:hypothetical protein